MDILQVLVEKFPAFDPEWSEDAQAAWFTGFERMLGMVERSQAPITPAAPNTPPAAPATAAVTIGKSVHLSTPAPERRRSSTMAIDPETVARMHELVAQGKSFSVISRELGVAISTVSRYVRLGDAAPTAEPEATPAGFRPASKPTNGTGG